MYLSKLIIVNNKSCKKIVLQPSKNAPEIMIGINDSGKSTILKSLEVFFDEKKTLSFAKEDQQKSDFSNTPLTKNEINDLFTGNNLPLFTAYKEDFIFIICEFELEQKDLKNKDIQESSKNLLLKWAMNDSKKICVLRAFQDPEYGQNESGHYMLVNDFKEQGEYLETWNKNQAELSSIRKKLEVSDEDVKNENGKGPFKNIEEIRAIYGKVKKNLEARWAFYKDFSKDKYLFPNFKYLDWNFSLKDLEDLANSAMNEVTEPLVAEIRELASRKQTEAMDKVNSKFDELITGLKEELPASIKKISSTVFFDVEKRITDIKMQKEGSDGDIHLENQGDGIKRQIWFAILKWRSKLSTGSTGNRHIWCFDEPETHLYPAAQRNLFSTFLDMCSNEFQLLVSTHSTVFIDRTNITSINKISLENGYSLINKTNNVDDIFDALGLQNSDFLFFDKFIAVEGYTEYELIPRLYKLKYNRALIEDGIQIINLKGENKYESNKGILESILSDFQKTNNKVFYLLDNDTGKTGNNISLIGKYDIEDSIANDVWIRFIQRNCDITVDDNFLNTEIRRKLGPNSKFHNLLADYIAKNCISGKFLPKKSECGVLLADCFESVSEIPDAINKLFESMINNV